MNHSSTNRNDNFSNYSLILRNIYERRLSMNDADKEESMFHNKKWAKHGSIPDEKKVFFLKVLGFFLMKEESFSCFWR